VIAGIALAVTLAALPWAASRTCRALAPELPSFGKGALGFGLVIGAFLTVIPLSGRIFRSFDAAIVTLALASIVVLIVSRRLEIEADEHPPWRIDQRFLLATFAASAVYAWVAWHYQMHDEHPIFGHKSMIEQLRRGEYPIYFPPIPSQDARYHYGFDILAGTLARGFGFSTDLAIDTTTMICVVFMCWAAAAVVADLGRPKASPFAAIAIHFGAGLAWLLLAGVDGRHPRCLVQYHHPSCGSELFPTPFNNVFQHPVSVGVPMLLVVLLAARRAVESEDRSHVFAALLVLLLPALAIGQIVYFALGALAILFALPLWLRHEDRRGQSVPRSRALRLAGVLFAGLVLARLSGGMLTPSEHIDAGVILFRRVPGFPDPNPLSILWHHLVNLGIGFVLLPYFGWLALKRRDFLLLVLTAFAAGGIIVPHFWVYQRSWDIVKFPSAAAFALSILYVAFVDGPLLERDALWPWLRRSGRMLLLGSGILAATFVVWPLQGPLELYDDNPFVPDPIVKKAIDWWLDRGYERDEIIWAQSNVAQQLSVFGGLSVVANDYDFQSIGIKAQLLQEQAMLSDRIRQQMDLEALRRLGVRWLLLSNEELDNLGPRARAVLEGPALELAHVIPGENPRRTRKIWRVR
jgi:hypothetical protein